ncbi:MAG: PEP-CTERM sorting domain-containing protein [Myxococcales bacterium]|nr:PEP-CTERM sorting domain-containing protein [Myxococcales bacterium]
MRVSLGVGIAIAGLCLLAPSRAQAAVITFDAVVAGSTSFGFDGDGDAVDDVVFSTTDPGGFNTFGPGTNQNFIDEPGIEGTSLLDPDLRVDFLNGASGSIGFGFALLSEIAGPGTFASIELFDADDDPLGEEGQEGTFTFTPGGLSDFPEGRIELPFSGVAAYGLFDFGSEGGRYIIDDFEGTFGSTETVPEPRLALLWAAVAASSALYRRAR